MNDHDPLVLDKFMGLWDQSDDESNKNSCPPDHFLQATNLDFENNELVLRDSFGTAFTFTAGTPRRAWLFQNSTATCFLIETTGGNLYALYIPPSVPSEVLLIAGSPSWSYNFQMWDERVYISSSIEGYQGNGTLQLRVFDGTTIRAASAGSLTPGAATVANSSSGVVQQGTRFFGVAFITDTGYITRPTPTSPASLVTPGNQLVAFTSIPTGPSYVTGRLLVATRAIANPIPGATLHDYQYYAVAVINDNVTTSFNANFYDSQLLNDVSYLSDQPLATLGAVQITEYHKRLVLLAPVVSSFPANIHSVLISRPFEPEQFDLVTGYVVVDPGRSFKVSAGFNTGVIDARAFRDVLYVAKTTSTYSLTDNGDEPVFWPIAVIDDSLGSFRNGISEVLDAAGQSVLYLLIANKSGIYIFTGYFLRPELTWKIGNFWRNKLLSLGGKDVLRSDVKYSLVNDSFNKKLYFIIYEAGLSAGSNTILFADYNNVDSDLASYSTQIKWSEWIFGFGPVGNFVAQVTGTKVNIFLLKIGSLLYPTRELMTLGGTTYPNTIAAFITSVFKTPQEDLQHIGAVRLNAYFSGTGAISTAQQMTVSDALSPTLNKRYVDLPTLDFEQNNHITPTFLTNFIAQRFQFSLVFTGNIQPGFILRKIVLFVKKIYQTLPYQFKKS